MGELKFKSSSLDTYKIFRHLMNNGDLLEFSSFSTVGKLIRLLTRRDVNHTALVWSVDEFKNVKDRRFIMEALSEGLELNLISDRLEGYKGDVYWYSLKEEYGEYRDTVASICLLAEGRTKEIKYDYLSLFRNAYKKVSVDVEKYSFCSEFAQWVLEESGILKKQKSALRPGEFDDLGIFKPRIQIYKWKK